MLEKIIFSLVSIITIAIFFIFRILFNHYSELRKDIKDIQKDISEIREDIAELKIQKK